MGGRYLTEVVLFIKTPLATALTAAVAGKAAELLIKWSFQSISRRKKRGGYADKGLDRSVVIYGPDRSVLKKAIVHSDGSVTEYNIAGAITTKRFGKNLAYRLSRIWFAAVRLFRN